MERLKKDLIGEGFYQETGGPGSIKKKVVSKKEVLTRWVLSHVNVVSSLISQDNERGTSSDNCDHKQCYSCLLVNICTQLPQHLFACLCFDFSPLCVFKCDVM